MNPSLSPRSASIVSALARRCLRLLAPAAAWALMMMVGFALMGALLAGVTATILLMAGPWMEPIKEFPMSSVERAWACGVAIGLTLAWAAYDASQSNGLFGLLSFRRPFKSAMIVVGSGGFFMMDRLRQWGSIGAGDPAPEYTKPMDLSAPTRADASVLRSRPWVAALDPVTLAVRGSIKAAKLTPLAGATLIWGAPSMAMAFAVLPFAGLEALLFWLAPKAALFFKTPLFDRARGALDALADEGAQDLALSERAALERQAGEGSAQAASTGPRRGL